MRSRSSRSRGTPGLALWLLAAAACGPRPGPNGGAASGATENDLSAGGARLAGTGATAQQGLVPVLGVPLGGSPTDVADALDLPPPGSRSGDDPAAAETIEADLVVAGLAGRVSVRFHQGRASDLSFDVTGPAATEAAYRALAARAADDLGPGAATRCESEDGVPFDEYLRTGNGLLETAWRDGPIRGEVQLDNGFAAGGSLQLHAFFAVPDLLPPPEDLVRGPQAAPRPAGWTRAAKQAPSGCRVELAGAPAAVILDLPFGADRAAIEARLGRPFEDEQGDLALPFELAGVPGRLHAAFYDGCLAVLLFVVEGEAATPASYRRLRDWARETPLGAGDGFRCRSEAGVEEQAYIEAGFGQRATQWRGGDPLEGSLWLHRAWSGEPGTVIVFEANYRPLRDHAPQIDFAGPGPGRPRSGGPVP